MSYAAEHSETCADPGCSASVGTSKWERVRAQDEGWFFQRNGLIWCPVHVPDWVPAWRDKQKRG